MLGGSYRRKQEDVVDVFRDSQWLAEYVALRTTWEISSNLDCTIETMVSHLVADEKDLMQFLLHC